MKRGSDAKVSSSLPMSLPSHSRLDEEPCMTQASSSMPDGKPVKASQSRKRKNEDEAPEREAPQQSSIDKLSEPSFWLMKNEPHDFSIEDLMASPDQTRYWDGVRGAEARNHMKKMRLGDKVFFYYSSVKVPRCVGLMEVAKEAYPDYMAWDPSSKYYDPSSKEGEAKWVMVDLRFIKKLTNEVTLTELKSYSETRLKGMPLLSRPRLSVSPVTSDQAEFILQLANTDL